MNTLREMMGISHALKGSLFLFDDGAGELELAAFFAPTLPPVDGGKWKPGEGVAGRIFAERKPVLVKDICREPRFHPNGFTHYRTGSFMSIPLYSPLDKPVGLINLSDRADGDPFNEQDLQSVSVLALYACIIANNMVVAASLSMEKDRLEEQKRLLSSYTSVGKLAAGIVHEINNPLDGIIRFTNMLLDLPESNSQTREYLLEIRRGLSKIEGVTRSLLQFSHHVDTKRMMIRNYVDLAKLVEEALIACEAKMRGDIVVHRNIAVTRRVFDMGLSQVFTNMIQNALDAMSGGGRLDIDADVVDAQLRIVFRDSGAGISPALTERIFDPFFSDKDSVERPGLGLAKCREIIDRYNGVIKVDSRPGEGTVFSIGISAKFLENEYGR